MQFSLACVPLSRAYGCIWFIDVAGGGAAIDEILWLCSHWSDLRGTKLDMERFASGTRCTKNRENRALIAKIMADQKMTTQKTHLLMATVTQRLSKWWKIAIFFDNGTSLKTPTSREVVDYS